MTFEHQIGMEILRLEEQIRYFNGQILVATNKIIRYKQRLAKLH